MKPSRFLLLPCLERGKGTGHLHRSLALARCLRSKGAQALLVLERGGADERGAGEVAAAFAIEPGEWIAAGQVGETRGSVFVFDNFATGMEEFEGYRSRGFCLGVDEGGGARSSFDYLIDVLPRVSKKDPPNKKDALEFLELPPRGREYPERIRRVLISMGGEDPEGLGALLARALGKIDAGKSLEIDLLRGALCRSLPARLGAVRVLEPLPDLKSALKDYDLVICQFGLTAYEALASGAAVLLLNPGPYHEALSRSAGFASLGAGSFASERLAAFIRDPRSLREASLGAEEALSRARDGKEGASGIRALADFLLGLETGDLPAGRACVACEEEKGKRPLAALWRDGTRSYFRCPACSSLRMLRACENPIRYGESYFFEEYRRQYGKTYLEDFPALRRMARGRLEKIAAHSGGLEGKRVLDIGCAYGAFLLEAKDMGALAFGIDPAPEAVEYLGGSLGIEALQGYFPDPRLEALAREAPFDIVTMWYVAEHLPDLRAALDAVRGLLRPGGIFAFSTPSASGVSARFDPDSFFRASPMDHQSILSPASSRRALRYAGFRPLGFRSTGHHPERFPLGRRVTEGPKYAMLGAISRLFALGDTFEAYASRI